jgi:hypothetical protein
VAADIIERLQIAADGYLGHDDDDCRCIYCAAADEIERLRRRPSPPSLARKVHHRSPYAGGKHPACQVRAGLDLTDDPDEVTCRSCIRHRESGQLERDRAFMARKAAEEAERG